MEEGQSKKSIISSIIGFYLFSLELAVLISSLFFSFWILLGVIFGLDYSVILGMAAISLIFLYPKRAEQLSEKTKRIIAYIKKTVITFGSIVVLVLFINFYLKASTFLNQQFSEMLNRLESFLNTIVFSVGILIIFLLISTGFVLLFLWLLFQIIRIAGVKNKLLEEIITVLVVFSFSVFAGVNVLQKSSLFATFSLFVYTNLNWIFGFSLVSLHITYLIKEAAKVLKVGVIKNVNEESF